MLIFATILFVATVAIVTVCCVGLYMRLSATPEQRQRDSLVALLVLDGWLALTGLMATWGLFSDFSTLPPRVVPVILFANLMAVVIAFSELGNRLAQQTPLVWLVGIQSFRIAVEVVLALLYHAGIVPVQMTIEGRNWDVLTGLTAPLIVWLIRRDQLPNWALVLWNVVGLGLLINIVTIAFLSMPTTLRVFLNDPSNTFITTLPFIWLPTLLVPVALCAHLLVFRYLWVRR